MVYKILRQRGQHLFVRRGIGCPQIVDRIHQPTPHEISEYAIDNVPSEVWILLVRKPFCERHAPVFQRIERHRLAIERCWRKRFQQARINHVARCLGEDNRLAAFRPVLYANAREQICKLIILFLRPLFEWMIVASCARQPLPQERLRGVFAQ